jgi:hypothetical protein
VVHRDTEPAHHANCDGEQTGRGVLQCRTEPSAVTRRAAAAPEQRRMGHTTKKEERMRTNYFGRTRHLADVPEPKTIS